MNESFFLLSFSIFSAAAQVIIVSSLTMVSYPSMYARALSEPLMFFWGAGIIALVAKLLHSLTAPRKSKSYVATISFPAFFLRWWKNRSLTLPDVLYQVGLSSTAPLVQVSLGPGMSAYVVRSSELTAQVAKHSQNLSMIPFYELVPKIGGLDRRSAAILRKDMGSRKVANVFSEMHRAFLQSLVPGPEYDRIIKTFTVQFGENVGRLHKDIAGNGILDPYKWLQRSWVNAMGVAAWGQGSPFLDFGVVDDWWTFRNSATTILFGVMPAFLFADTRAAMRARTRVLKPFSEYYNKIYNASDTFDIPQRVLQYVASGKKWGFDHQTLARLDLSNTFGLFKDPIDAAYGMLVHICSRSDVLAAVRAELESAVTRTADGKISTLHAHRIRTACPLFTSCYYEAVRLTGGGFPVRSITSDFDVDGTTFRKGGLVVLSSVAIHRDPQHWPDPETFKADRFVGVRAPEAEMQRTYRVFGGGAAICAGRHMSPPLVLTAVASLLLGFDMKPQDGDGAWAIPRPENARVPEAATPPRDVGNTNLVTCTRAGYEGVEWALCADCALAA